MLSILFPVYSLTVIHCPLSTLSVLPPIFLASFYSVFLTTFLSLTASSSLPLSLIEEFRPCWSGGKCQEEVAEKWEEDRSGRRSGEPLKNRCYTIPYNCTFCALPYSTYIALSSLTFLSFLFLTSLSFLHSLLCVPCHASICAPACKHAHIHTCNRVERILNAGTQVISALQIFQEEVAPCLPPDYAPMDTFINAFEEELEAHIESKNAVHNPILAYPTHSHNRFVPVAMQDLSSSLASWK